MVNASTEGGGGDEGEENEQEKVGAVRQRPRMPVSCQPQTASECVASLVRSDSRSDENSDAERDNSCPQERGGQGENEDQRMAERSLPQMRCGMQRE